jgi:hypothetical protein
MNERVIFRWPGYLDEFAIEAERQGFSSEVLLETVHGPLMVWEKAGKGPLVYISSGIHGDEPAGPAALLEMLRSGIFSDHHHWLVCPALNPSGLALGRRENLHGIDLNRDYLNRVSSEVASHEAWLARHLVPDVFVSLHEDWETDGFYFYEINLMADHPGRARDLLHAVSEHVAIEASCEIDGHEVREPGWIYHGAEADLPNEWPEAIYLAKRGCPVSFTFETPSKECLEKRVAAHISGFRRLMAYLS